MSVHLDSFPDDDYAQTRACDGVTFPWRGHGRHGRLRDDITSVFDRVTCLACIRVFLRDEADLRARGVL